MALREPMEVDITCQDGTAKTYIISKVPATVGIELVMLMPSNALPKVGDYATFEKCLYKMLAYVGVPRDSGEPLMLTTKALCDNHCPDWEVLGKLGYEMVKYNCSFFQNGRVFGIFSQLAPLLQALSSQMSMGSSAPLSEADKQPSTS